MYIALLVVLVAIALGLVAWGVNRSNRFLVVAGVLAGVATVVFLWLLNFWGEKLWFDALGYSGRFWRLIAAKWGFTILGVSVGWGVVCGLTWTRSRDHRQMRFWARLLGAYIGANWGYSQWETILRFFYRVPTDLKDPILGMTTSFYLFTLPFYYAIFALLVLLTLVAAGTVLVSLFVRISQGEITIVSPSQTGESVARRFRPLYASATILLLVLAGGKYLDRFNIMYSSLGAAAGPGWTDVHVRLPAYFIVIALTGLLGVFVAVSPLRHWFRRQLGRLSLGTQEPRVALLGVLVATTAVIWFAALVLLPRAFQWLRVEPNEITFEAPYIEHNIRFTRHGFGLNDVEEREFPASDRFTREMVDENRSVFNNIRLWDWRALIAVHKQFQEIRLYYEFPDIDIDRYRVGGDYLQTMVSGREMEVNNLPRDSQTFVNRRFKYTHGYGITLTPVSEFTREGLPDFLIKDIPPRSEHPDLTVERPQIYYGNLTDSYVVVNTDEEEFDYPSGEKNIYIHYPGKGGVQLSNIWRKFLYGWKFDGTRFFLSGYPTSESRVMFHRQIGDRARRLAPFLVYDEDPYICLVDGRLYWILDAYTVSRHFPYSQPFTGTERIEFSQDDRRRVMFERVREELNGINYIRNSVKVVVDAFEGAVNFYVFEEEDPIIQVWSKVFPELFRKEEEMPAGLRAHVRYPRDMLLIQGLVYAKYHMTDPAVFYNQEDLWVRATEKYYNQVQPIEPYYIMWQQPGSEEAEFVLILPFTPKRRQVSIGWIAGMCDGENYGRFLAYKFPKERRVLGPQQVETKIDQDSFLSGQLSLWDQRGSNVIRGNVLAIPIGDTLLYVEPIYLQAETAAYPELRLVCVMHNDNLSYAETFGEAIEGLFRNDVERRRIDRTPERPEALTGSLAREANQAFEDYLRFLGERDFDQVGGALKRLEDSLNRLQKVEDQSPAQVPEFPRDEDSKE